MSRDQTQGTVCLPRGAPCQGPGDCSPSSLPLSPLRSRLYFGESNVDGMLDTLLPLHEMMKENGPSTLQEIAFVQVQSSGMGLGRVHGGGDGWVACWRWSSGVLHSPVPLQPLPATDTRAPSAASSPPPKLPHCTSRQAYGRELDEAYEWCLKFKQSRREAELHQAWDLYYHVFRKINKQLPSLSVLELQYVAPALVRAKVLSGGGGMGGLS